MLLCFVALSLSAVPGHLADADVAPDCKPGKDYAGSIHAAVAYDVDVFAKPKSKEKQVFDCGSKPAALFLLELGEKDAKSYADAYGAQLWGESGPTAEHDDELLVGKGVVAMVSGPGSAPIVARLEKKGFAKHRLTPLEAGTGPIEDQFAAAIDCSAKSNDPLRAWCPATQVKKAGFKAPPKMTTFVGLTAAVKKGANVRKALLEMVAVSALSVGGGKIFVQDITPENDGEKRQLMEVAMSVAQQLKGGKGGVVVAKDLGGFLDSLTAKNATKGYDVKDDPAGAKYTAKSPSRAWRVKDAFVVFEDAPDGTWVNIYPAVPYTAR
jgi:hypothetical protein